MSIIWWVLVRIFSNHQYNDQDSVRPLPSSNFDLQIARLQDYATSPSCDYIFFIGNFFWLSFAYMVYGLSTAKNAKKLSFDQTSLKTLVSG